MSNPDNLRTAFAGAYQAELIYLAFLPKAHKRWGGKVGRLFQAVVAAEINKQSQGMQVVGSTCENLAAAREYEFEVLYPNFIAETQQEGNQEAEFFCNFVNEA